MALLRSVTITLGTGTSLIASQTGSLMPTSTIKGRRKISPKAMRPLRPLYTSGTSFGFPGECCIAYSRNVPLSRLIIKRGLRLIEQCDRPLHWLGRAVLVTFLPPGIRKRQRLADPNPVLEFMIKKAFKLFIDFGDAQPDPVVAPIDAFYANIQSWDMREIDVVETEKRDAQTRRFNIVFTVFAFLVLGSLGYHYSNIPI